MNGLLFQVLSFSLNFVLLLLLLWKLLVPRLSAMMDKRRENIHQTLDETEKSLADVSQELDAVRQELKQAEHNISSISDEAEARAKAASAKIKADTEHEIQQLRDKVERQIQQEFHNLHLSLRAELVQQVTVEAEAQMRKANDAAAQQQLIKNFAYSLEGFKEYKS
jgi:F-type H+-transporting ATPase subunit b